MRQLLKNSVMAGRPRAAHLFFEHGDALQRGSITSLVSLSGIVARQIGITEVVST